MLTLLLKVFTLLTVTATMWYGLRKYLARKKRLNIQLQCRTNMVNVNNRPPCNGLGDGPQWFFEMCQTTAFRSIHGWQDSATIFLFHSNYMLSDLYSSSHLIFHRSVDFRTKKKKLIAILENVSTVFATYHNKEISNTTCLQIHMHYRR